MKNLYIILLLSFSSVCYSQNACPGVDSINYGGQWYHTVQIGNQCWLKENLNIGKMIPAVKDQSNNDTIEKFCYNNDPAMCDVYGGLYQWREAMQYTQKQGIRGICPTGWHIPLQADFDSLISIVHGDGNALKKKGQGGGTNTSGFSAMLSGFNQYTSFNDLGINAYFLGCDNIWTWGDYEAGTRFVDYTTISSTMPVSHYFTLALSTLNVRCLKDNAGLLVQVPSGGEKWQVGTMHKISWGGDLADKKIKVEYTTDNGISWLEITLSTPAIDGEYNWTIPNTPSKYCRIKISYVSIPDTVSISNNVFTIYNDPCPTGSLVEYGGKKYKTAAIDGRCWFKENVNIGTMIPGSKQAVSNGIIEKYCYNDDTANCSIYGGLYSYSEQSEDGFCPAFWHAEGIDSLEETVLYDGNALKEVGQGSGFGSGSNTSGFSILLAGYRETNGSFLELGATANFPYGYGVSEINNLSHSVSFNNGDISWNDQWNINVGSSYRCVRAEVGPLLLKSPVGGESWQVGSTQKITWSFSNVINIKIDYTTDNGSSWINIIASTPTSTASYSWTIPNTPSTNCKVRISSVNNTDTNSASNNVFRIFRVGSDPCPGIPTISYGGQTYNTIVIGDQCWLKENLNIGIMIDSLQNQTNNGIIEKYCYNDDSIKCSKYGGLYQWDEAMQYDTTEGAKGVCPTGWHIPSWNEFATLKTFVGGNGNDLKDIGQGSGSGSGTNTSGFSALLAGIIYHSIFYYLDNNADYWTSRKYDSTSGYNFQLVSTANSIQGLPVNEMAGFSIRCINDSSVSSLPVELTTFTASVLYNTIKLIWNTVTEINFSSFDIEKQSPGNNTWQKIASVKATGNSTSPKQYSYADKKVNSGKYSYRLKMVDFDGSFKYSNIISAEIVAPLKFELSNAYPNPWNPTTTIRYQVPVNIFVTIKVFDALGKEVATLVNETKPAGNYDVTFNGKGLSSGIYYYQMKAGNFIETKKIILLK